MHSRLARAVMPKILTNPTRWRCNLEGIVPIELDLDIAWTNRVSTVLLNGD
jgi:hypothetical protein